MPFLFLSPLVLPVLLVLSPWLHLRRVWSTTLFAAWCWLLLAAVSLAGLIYVYSLPGGPARFPFWFTCGRYLVCCLSVAPIMANLGAKWPQHGPWQFIVFSLLVVLLLPVAQSQLFPNGRGFGPHPIWPLFLVVLVGMGALNYCFTRFWMASMLFACGQMVLLSPYLSLPWGWVNGFPPVWAGMFAVAAALGESYRKAESRAEQSPAKNLARTGYCAAWAEFKLLFGAFWALRFMERMQQFSEQYDWPVRLTWDGWQPVENRIQMVVPPADKPYAPQPGFPTQEMLLAGESRELEGLAPEDFVFEYTDLRRGFASQLCSDRVELWLSKLKFFDASVRSTWRRFVSPEWLDTYLPQKPK